MPQPGMLLGEVRLVLEPAVRQAPLAKYHWFLLAAPVKSSLNTVCAAPRPGTAMPRRSRQAARPIDLERNAQALAIRRPPFIKSLPDCRRRR